MAIGDDPTPVTVKPSLVVMTTEALDATFPTFLSVTVAVAGRLGVVETATGSLVTTTALIAGMTNVLVTVCVTAGAEALVAVNLNETCVPGKGSVPDGCR